MRSNPKFGEREEIKSLLCFRICWGSVRAGQLCGGQNVEAFVHPGSHSSAPSTSPQFPFCCHRDFCSVGAFFVGRLLANAEMSDVGRVPFADALPAVWRRRGRRGPFDSLVGEVSGISPCPGTRVSGKSLSTDTALFSSPELQTTVSRNCVDGHAHEEQHPWHPRPPQLRDGDAPVSTDIPQLPGPGVCAGLGQAPLLRGFAGSRRVLGSVPPFKASPDLDSLPARAQPPGSALPPLLPAAGRGPAERARLLLLVPAASAPAERERACAA